MEEDLCQRKVVFTDVACKGIDGCVGENARKSKSKFYEDTDSFKAAVTEVRAYCCFYYCNVLTPRASGSLRSHWLATLTLRMMSSKIRFSQATWGTGFRSCCDTTVMLTATAGLPCQLSIAVAKDAYRVGSRMWLLCGIIFLVNENGSGLSSSDGFPRKYALPAGSVNRIISCWQELFSFYCGCILGTVFFCLQPLFFLAIHICMVEFIFVT